MATINPIEDEVYDVIIIGAGISGISCAHHLAAHRHQGRILILEGRNRIGGRIHGQQLQYSDGKMVEMGAQWIHGLLGNPIYDIASKNGLVDALKTNERITPSAHLAGSSKDEAEEELDEMFASYRHKVMGLTEDGQNVSLDLIEEIYRAYFFFMKRCETYYESMEKNPLPLGVGYEPPARFVNSVGRHMRNDIDEFLNALAKGSNPPDSEKMKLIRSIFNQLLWRETVISGCHAMEDVSLRDFGSYEELPGGNLIIPGGYLSILHVLLKEIANFQPKFSLLTNKKVTQIEWKIKPPQSSEYFVNIHCDDGSRYVGKHVVITIPVGVLKEASKTLFNPHLPDYKEEVISRLGFGVVDKIYLEFSKPLSKWISPKCDEILMFWSLDDKAEKEGIYDNEHWYRKIYSFDRVTSHCLRGWISGKEALYMESLSDQEIGEKLTQVLRKCLCADDFPEPDLVKVTRWGSDPFTRGSYTYIHNNGSVKDTELLSQPIYADPAQDKPLLVFAGEACHTSFYSTVHGAYLTGRKAAYYLLDVNESNSTPTNSSDVSQGATSIIADKLKNCHLRPNKH